MCSRTVKYFLFALISASLLLLGIDQKLLDGVESCVSTKSNECTFQSSEIELEEGENLETKLHLVDLDELLSECGPYGIDIRELTISQINEHFRMGRLTSLELTQSYLNRISEMDVYLRSVIEVNLDALMLAQREDFERSAGLNDNPIHGIPILLKDNIGTADSMQTTAGSLALEDLKPIRDAVVVTRLRQAGAIILGKASLSEWAKYETLEIL